MTEPAGVIPILVPVRRVSVDRCARCGDFHGALNVFRFARPVEHRGEVVASHWALCLTTGEPILIRDEAPAPGSAA